jgi:hypothetical protein
VAHRSPPTAASGRMRGPRSRAGPRPCPRKPAPPGECALCRRIR